MTRLTHGVCDAYLTTMLRHVDLTKVVVELLGAPDLDGMNSFEEVPPTYCVETTKGRAVIQPRLELQLWG